MPRCWRRSARCRRSRSTASSRPTRITRRCARSTCRRNASSPSSASTCSRASSTAACTARPSCCRPSSSGAWRSSDETRTIGWVAVPAREFEAAVALDDAAIAAYYEANQSRYMSEEQATVDFVELDIDAYAAKADVSEAGAARVLRGEQGALHAGGPPARAPHPVRRGQRRCRGRGECEARLRARHRRRGLRRARARTVRGPGLEGLRGRPRRGRARGLRRALRRRRVEHEAGRDPRAGEDRVRLARHQARGASPEIIRSFEDVRAELEPEFRHAQVEKAFGDAQEELDTTAFEAQGDIGAVASKLRSPASSPRS